MDHHMGTGAGGEMPGHEDKMAHSQPPQRHYIPPLFRKRKDQAKRFSPRYGYQAGKRDGWGAALGRPESARNSRLSQMPGPWRMGIGGFASACPNHNNYVEVYKEKLDAWGIPP